MAGVWYKRDGNYLLLEKNCESNAKGCPLDSLSVLICDLTGENYIFINTGIFSHYLKIMTTFILQKDVPHSQWGPIVFLLLFFGQF